MPTIWFCTGEVTESESLFYYHPGVDASAFSFPDHEPSFADEVVDRYTDEQRRVCNNDASCLFDTFETKDVEIGTQTREFSTTTAESSKTIGEFTK